MQSYVVTRTANRITQVREYAIVHADDPDAAIKTAKDLRQDFWHFDEELDEWTESTYAYDAEPEEDL